MQLHADFRQRVVDLGGSVSWQPSPLPGVERRMLDRVGDELARATSVVRYAPGSRFAQHRHGGGEEVLVLDGVFSDETGDHGPGSYLRNPPGSAHAPWSDGGCTLFVKLWQFAADDRVPLRVDTRAAAWRPGLVPGLAVLPLHSHGGVDTALVRWAPHTRFQTHVHPAGEEIFVIDGVFNDEGGAYPRHSWLRSPAGSRHTPFTGPEGALIYVKVGHLAVPFTRPTEASSA